ncbi:MAG: acyltransferase family protein, partial [Spirochaetota bacterium]
MQITKIPVSIYRFYKEGMLSIFVARKSEIPALNGLRAFAILLILFLHLWEGLLKKGLVDVPFILERLFNSCHSAIEIFYALSGYLIYGGLISAKEKNPAKPIDFKKFYINRTLRIFPAYYFFIFITYGIIFLQKLLFEKKFALGEK